MSCAAATARVARTAQAERYRLYRAPVAAQATSEKLPGIGKHVQDLAQDEPGLLWQLSAFAGGRKAARVAAATLLICLSLTEMGSTEGKPSG